MFQLRITLRQFPGVEVDDLAEKQVHDQSALGQLVRLDADVDRHPLLPQVGEQEVVAARGRIEYRIEPWIQWLLEGAQDRGKRLVRLGQQIRERGARIGAQEVPLRQALEIRLEFRFYVSRGQSVDRAQRRLLRKRKTAAGFLFPSLEEI